jgi:hypothetical protein
VTREPDLNPLFQQALVAIDASDLSALQRLLHEHPELATTRLEHPGEWLRSRVGSALDDFFARPYLLWFVAEDPVRADALPSNICQVAETIIAVARRERPDLLQEQLDYALTLVSWSWVAARCGVQLDLIDTLIDAGAAPAGNANNALVNRHVAAAERLIARGGTLTLAAALCLERWNELPALAEGASASQCQFALVLAALNGNAKAIAWMLANGADLNAPSESLYSHGTPLHHAVSSGALDAVRVLVDAGADLARTDTAWGGTPLCWAQHYIEERVPGREAEYAAIAAFLQECCS